MKKEKKLISLLALGLLLVLFAACNGTQAKSTKSSTLLAAMNYSTPQSVSENTHVKVESNTSTNSTSRLVALDNSSSYLNIQFGQRGPTYKIKMQENATAKKIFADVGRQSWNLPIYHYDDFTNSDVMQYYDIPRHYKYEASPVTVTEEKVGQIYYSEPNRIILFYKDAKVKADYVLIGEIENTKDLSAAVEKNPVLQGWGNKLVLISADK